jgi:spermidine synthase
LFLSVGQDAVAGIYELLLSVFSNVKSYRSYIPSFWSDWGFVIATDSNAFSHFTKDNINTVLSQRGVQSQLKYYDGETHEHMFALSKRDRALLKN